MTHVPRTALFLLLALTQIIAPWVHAHAGEETGGFMHLPGLEFRARDDRAALTPAAARMGDADWIVGIQAGIRHGGEAAASWPHAPDPAPTPLGCVPSALAWVADPPYIQAPPPLFHAFRGIVHPRAPPPIPAYS